MLQLGNQTFELLTPEKLANINPLPCLLNKEYFLMFLWMR